MKNSMCLKPWGEYRPAFEIPPSISVSAYWIDFELQTKDKNSRKWLVPKPPSVDLIQQPLWVDLGRRSSYHPLTPCSCTYFAHARTCDNFRVKSATQWTASVHTVRMSQSVINFLLEEWLNDFGWQLNKWWCRVSPIFRVVSGDYGKPCHPLKKWPTQSLPGAFWTMHQHQLALPAERHRDSSSKVQVGVRRFNRMVEMGVKLREIFVLVGMH